MVRCPGETKTGKVCRRVVAPGASMCDEHCEIQRRADYNRHCQTKCKGQGYEHARCNRKRLSPDTPLCKRCNDALLASIERARVEAAARQAEYQQRRQRELARFHEFTAECEWWPGFEHWLDDKLADIESRLDNCKQLSYCGSM